MTEERVRKAWLWAGLGFVALVAYLSLTPDPFDAGRMGQVKVGHFIAYAWLVLWFAQMHAELVPRFRVWAIFALMGVLLEYLQGQTGYRSFAYSDMRDNAIGGFVGMLLAYTPLGKVYAMGLKAGSPPTRG